jgi:hypothetical protein
MKKGQVTHAPQQARQPGERDSSTARASIDSLGHGVVPMGGAILTISDWDDGEAYSLFPPLTRVDLRPAESAA